MVKHWRGLPKEAVESSSMEILKTQMDKQPAASDPAWLGIEIQWASEVPSNLRYSMFLGIFIRKQNQKYSAILFYENNFFKKFSISKYLVIQFSIFLKFWQKWDMAEFASFLKCVKLYLKTCDCNYENHFEVCEIIF